MLEVNMQFEDFVESELFCQQESKFAFVKLDDSPMFRQQGLEQLFIPLYPSKP